MPEDTDSLLTLIKQLQEQNTFEKYKLSMKEELNFFYENNLIKEIDRRDVPVNEFIIPSKWVLSEKLDSQSTG